MRTTPAALLLMVAILSIAACGGGGGEGTNPKPSLGLLAGDMGGPGNTDGRASRVRQASALMATETSMSPTTTIT